MVVRTYSQNFSTLAQLESVKNKWNKFKNEINGLLILAHALGVSRPCIIEVRAYCNRINISVSFRAMVSFT